MQYAIATIGYKSVDNIKARINEAHASTIKPSEIVVVINPYEDNINITQRIIEYVSNDIRVTRWLLASQNVGCAKAFNMSFSLCRSPIIVALSDDCSVGPTTYEKMLSEFSDPLVGIAGVEEGFRNPPDKFLTPKGFILMYRKKMLSDIGGYNEELSPLADERELALRAGYNGWKSVIAKDCSWGHIHDVSNNPFVKIKYMGEIVTPDEIIKTFYPILEDKIKIYNGFKTIC